MKKEIIMFVLGGFCVFVYAGMHLLALSGLLGNISPGSLLTFTKITFGILCIGGVLIMGGGVLNNVTGNKTIRAVPSVTKKIIDELKSMQEKISELEKESLKK